MKGEISEMKKVILLMKIKKQDSPNGNYETQAL